MRIVPDLEGLLQKTLVSQFLAFVEREGSVATLQFLEGLWPFKGPDDTTGERLLAEIPIQFIELENGTLCAPDARGKIVGSGKVGWARLLDGGGRIVLDINDIGDTDSNAVIKLSSLQLQRGGELVVRSINLDLFT